MRILVISDSHHRTGVIDTVLSAQPTAKYVFFLGDNASDIEYYELLYPDKTFFTVCGNCDYLSFLPTTGVQTINGKRIFYTHGHTLGVKNSTEHLRKAAEQNGCDIALFGHTHISKIVYDNGIYLVNPGSVSNPRSGRPSYAVIDITDSGIMPLIIEL